MKKVLIICLILALVLVLTACFNKKEGGSNTPNNSSNEEYSYDFIENIGVDKNGTDVKRLVSKIITFNNNTEEKISVSLNALKGSVKTTSDEDKLLNIYSYIGGNSSLYVVKAYSSVIELPEEGTDSSLTSSQLSSAKILFINITQTEGTPGDPDIPFEVEQNLDDMYFIPDDIANAE